MDTVDHSRKSENTRPITDGDNFHKEDRPTCSDANPSRKKAPIWEHFTFVPTMYAEGGKQECAKCNYCGKHLKSAYGNTTGLRRHLQGKHYAKYVQLTKSQTELDFKKANQNSLTTVVSKKSVEKESVGLQRKITDINRWESKTPKARALTNEIGKWMASSLHPYSLADDEGLKRVLNLAQPMYTLPSSKTFSRSVIPSLYEDVKKTIKATISTNKPNLRSMSVTIDMWTSIKNDSFMALTSHFMDENFVINNFCLGCYHFEGEHTSDNINKKVKNCLEEWELKDVKVPIYSITDNASNMKLAMALSKPVLKPLSCFAHTLQLTLGDAKKHTPGMVDLVAKIRKLVGHFKHSSQATAKLHSIQEEMRKDSLQLIQDCETRWNSEYLMLSRFLINKEPLSRYFSDSENHDNLTVAEWKLVSGYVKILEPLFRATSEICSSTLPTCSMVIPIIYCIEEGLKTFIQEEEPGCGKVFARELLKASQTRFPNQMKTNPYIMAMLLDPRFKDVVLHEHERDLAMHNIKRKLKETKQIPVAVDETDKPDNSGQFN